MLDSVNRLRMIDVDPHDIPLEKIDVSQADLYEHDAHWGFSSACAGKTRSTTARTATSGRSGP